MKDISILEREIINLQKEKAEILKTERNEKRKLKIKQDASEMCFKRLNGISKEKAYKIILNKIIELSSFSLENGLREIFGIKHNCFLDTSLTIEDVKKDYFLLDLIILNVGIKLFYKLESTNRRADREAKNLMKRFYEKLGCKEITKYLKEAYPLNKNIRINNEN